MGLEPTTFCLQGRRSSQLNYRPNKRNIRVCSLTHSKPPLSFQSAILIFIIKNTVENSFCCICSLNLFGILIVRLYHYIYLIKLLMNSLFCSGNETRTRVNGLWSCRGQIRTGDLKLMKLVSYHCSTLRYICVLNFQVLLQTLLLIYCLDDVTQNGNTFLHN